MRALFQRLLVPGLVLALGSGLLSAQETQRAPANPLQQLSESFEALSEQVTPAVVEVFAAGFAAAPGQDPTVTGQITVGTNSGSGVFVDSQGYVITSAHLVAGARRVRIIAMLPGEGGRSVSGSVIRPRGRLMDAEVVGYDLETDVAVLKVPVRTLRYVRFADSDSVRKGQLVFAFGNPQGIEDAVAMGVISSIARQIRPEDPMIYLQTDAPITAGNSGGPLVNANGEMIGLNVFLREHAGSSSGYGFAAPSNIVRAVYGQIREYGRVRRGFIGLTAQTINPPMAEALNLPLSQGVIVSDVLPFSPADQAGIEIGDIIQSLDGKLMENGRQLTVNLYQRREGDKVTLELLRGGEIIEVESMVLERDEAPARLAKRIDPKDSFVAQLGVLGVDVNEDLVNELPFLRALTGVLVAALPAGIPAGFDFQPGDVIHSVNGVGVDNLAELREQLAGKGRGDIVVLQLERLGQMQYCTVDIQLGELR